MFKVTFKSHFPEIKDIQDKKLRKQVVEVWGALHRQSGWKRIEDAPFGPGSQHTLVMHIKAVARNAVNIARSTMELHGIDVNLDHVIAGALLHDASKLLEYSDKGLAEKGKLLPHAFLGGAFAWKSSLPLGVVHIIVSHSSRASINAMTIEAVIVQHADHADCDSILFTEGKETVMARLKR